MKIVAKAAVLANALTLVGMRASKKPFARIVAADGVVITCAGPHLAITAEAAATVLEPGELTISAERLGALVAGFALNATVTISTTESAAIIVCGNSHSRLAIIPDVPAAFAFADEIGCCEISGSNCLRLLEPLSAAGGEQTRYYLSGIFVHSVNEKLVAVSTDGVRLIKTSIPAGEFSTGRDLIIPAEAVMVLRRLVTRTKPHKVTLRRSRRLLSVAGQDFSFTSLLIDARYPGYEAFIPPTAPNAVSVFRIELLAVMSRLAAVSTADSALIAPAWANAGQLNLFLARQPDDGADAITAIECAGTAKIAIPLSQLTAMISKLKGDRVRLEAAEGQPLVIQSEAGKLALIAQAKWNFRESETAEVA